MSGAQTITFRMPAGIAGNVDRTFHSTIETQIMLNADPPQVYGGGVVMDPTGFVRAPQAGDTDFYGFLVRPFPTQSRLWPNDPLGTGTPPLSGLCDVLRKGYINVHVQSGAAVKGGAVYVRISGGTQTTPVGGIEGTAGGGVVAVPGAMFMGPADATGQCEISVDIGRQP